MKGYAIFTREKTLDSAEMALYFQQVAATFAGHEMNVLASYGKHEDIEGAPTEGTVIVEFPSVTAAKAWYDSPAYVEVRKHRFAGATYHAIIIEGV
jgi:uncharacterized protein (DUF1330 family)